MAQLIPLPLTVSCFSKIQIGFTFLVPAQPGSPGQRIVKRVCVLHVIMLPFTVADKPLTLNLTLAVTVNLTDTARVLYTG